MSSGEYGQEKQGPGDGTGRLLAGRYRVLAQLGRGGMGVVWRAVDEVLGREVAVKELRTYTDADGPELARLRLRMQREARAAARVRHPGVVAVHDVTEVDGRPLIVMELVDGPSLDDVLRERGPLEPREVAGIGAEVMDALAAAHRAGVLHRDVKPGNILLDRSGRVVLTDFGIASMDDPGDGSATHLTRSGELVGSLDYLAPERAQGADPGPASDIWALGATLYAAVEGSSPFRRTSTFSTLAAIVTEPSPEPRRAGELGPVLQRLLDKRPESRPEAGEARHLLRTAAETDMPTATLRGPADPAPARTAPERDVPAAPPGSGPLGVVEPTGAATPAGQAHRASAQSAPGTSASGTRREGSPAAQGSGVTGPTRPFEQAGPSGQAQLPGQAGPPAHGFGAKAAAGPGPAVTEPTPAGSGPTPHTFGAPDGYGTSATPPPAATGLMPAPSDSAPSRRRGRVLLAAAAVTVVLAAAGVTAALLDDNPRDTAAAPQPTASAPSADAPVSENAGRIDAERSGVPEPSGKGEGKSPSATKTPGGGTATDPAGRTTASAPGTSSAGSSTGGDGAGAPASSCRSIGGGRYDCEVSRTAKSFTASGAEAGVLNAGTNYFYCQQKLDRRETYGQWTNVWWAKTDDDSGNTGVYVSDVYIKGGDNDAPVPGLPVC